MRKLKTRRKTRADIEGFGEFDGVEGEFSIGIWLGLVREESHSRRTFMFRLGQTRSVTGSGAPGEDESSTAA